MNSEFTVWFGGIAILTSAACGAAQTTASKVELPAEVGALPPDLEDDYRVFATNCSKCHGLERPFSAPVTDHGHWERYVGRMMRTPGSGISAQEAPSILAFLFWYTDKKNARHSDTSQPAAAPAEPTPIIAPEGEGTP